MDAGATSFRCEVEEQSRFHGHQCRNWKWYSVDSARHVHAHKAAYAALVLSGRYEEAGDSGRHRVPVTLLDLNDYSLIGSNNQGVNGGGRTCQISRQATWRSTVIQETAALTSTHHCSAVVPLGSPGTSPRRFFYGPGIDNLGHSPAEGDAHFGIEGA